MKKTQKKFRLLLILCCLSMPLLTFAQPDPPEDTPIDGGLTVLLAAGAAYGVKKYRDHKKKGAEGDVEK